MDEPDVRTVESREVYRNPWMVLQEDVVQRRDGSLGQYAVVHSADFALIIPFDGERFHLVEQYRYPVQARLWEFPQGSVGAEHASSSEEMAAIELAEETGITAGRLERLGFLHASYGRSTNGFHAFLATDLTFGEPSREAEEQDMRVAAVTPTELWAMVDAGTITDSNSLAALALLDHAKRAGRDIGYR